MDSKENILLPPDDNVAATENDASNNTLGKSAFFIKSELKKEKEAEKIASLERDRESFFKILKNFHETRGTGYNRLPRIGSKEIDLHKLYRLVTAKGGWLKVNHRNDWDEVLAELGLPAKCVNAAVAIKHLYIRYLDRFEKADFHKEDPERPDDDDDESRHKRWSARTLHTVPMSYNYNQHNFSDMARTNNKLSTNLYKASEYEKILMSLMSPLPNEQDFAINVCTLMANENKPTLKIEKCPKIIDALLAHAGIYHHYTTREIFVEFYTKIRKNSLQSFWNDCLIDKPEILELSYDDYFAHDDFTQKKNEILKKIKKIHSCVVEMETTDDEDDDKEFNHLDFLCLGRGLGTNDYVGQRIHQVSAILRNLSFIEENIPILIRNRTFLRFLIICSNIRWGNLQHMGLDMLGNVSPELELNDPSSEDLTQHLLRTVSEGLECSDRAVVLSCLEILYKLCQNERNEDFLNRTLSKSIYSQVCQFLCLSDIMLLLYSLECIYSLSSLGEKSCNAICQVHGAIDTLVSLVTVEAQSYGPDACILMRVVETVSGACTSTIQTQQTHQTSFTTLNNVSSHSIIGGQQQQHTMGETRTTLSIQNQIITSHAHDSMHVSSTPIRSVTPHQRHNLQTSTAMMTTPSSTTSIVSQGMASPRSSIQLNTLLSQSSKDTTTNGGSVGKQQNLNTATTSNDKQDQQQVSQENEQFAMAWLRSTFEPVNPTSKAIHRIEQQDFYTLYVTASGKLGRCGFVAPMHFPRCVRNVFGVSVGPNPIKRVVNGIESTTHYYEGIKIRTKSLPIIHNGAVIQPNFHANPVQSPVDNTSKPIEQTKTQTTGFVSPPIHKTVLVNQAQAAQHIQQQQLQQQSVLQKALTTNEANSTSTQVVTPSTQNPPTMVTTQQQQQPMVSQAVQQQIVMQQPLITTSAVPQTQSSLIKSLLATKVTTTTDCSGNQNQPQIVASPASIVGGQCLLTSPPQSQLIQQQHTPPPTLIQSPQIPAAVATTTTLVTTTTTASAIIQPSVVNVQNVNMHQVAQRQQIQKQKELALQQQHQQHQLQQQQQQQQQIHQQVLINPGGLNIKAITSSKPPPLTPASPLVGGIIEKTIEKPMNWDPVPPLAPLSGIGTPIRHTHISVPPKFDEDSNSTGNSITSSNFSANQNDGDNSRTSFDDATASDDDAMSTSFAKEAAKHSQVITANKMLANLLEKKSDPPYFSVQGENTMKRKMDGSVELKDQPLEKRINQQDGGNDETDELVVKPTENRKAAELYAELAAKMLEDEDEDLEDEEELLITSDSKINSPPQAALPIPVPIPIPARIEIQASPQPVAAQQQQIQAQQSSQQQQMITVPIQRQIIVSPNNSQQMMFSPSTSHQMGGQMTQTTATIKTESGYQTVPVLLQHAPSSNPLSANIQLQKQIGGQIIHSQPMMQPQQQTQYVLTTNQQGQTVVVAQNPQPQMHQTVLVTQTPQQQGTTAKTIIILQQQPGSGQSTLQPSQIMNAVNSVTNHNQGTPQKMIMTTQQGQQVVVTQVPRPMQHHVIVNHGNQNQQIVLQPPNPQQIVMQQQQQQQAQQNQQQQQQQQQSIIIQQHQNPNQQQYVTFSTGVTQTTQTMPFQQQQQQQQQMQSHQIQVQETKRVIYENALDNKTIEVKIQGNPVSQLSTQSPQHLPSIIMQQQQHNLQQQQMIQQHTSAQVQQHQPTASVMQPTQTPVLQQTPTPPPPPLLQPQSVPKQPEIPVAPIQQTFAVGTPKTQSPASTPPPPPSASSQVPKPSIQTTDQSQAQSTTQQTPTPATTVSTIVQQQQQQSSAIAAVAGPSTPSVPPPQHIPKKIQKPEVEHFDNTWLWVCDWRGCPKKKFRSATEVYVHACQVHCPDNIDPNADIFCQWGPGPNLCDNLPRKRFSLMTHLFDRHCTLDSFKAASQRRIATGFQPQSMAQMQPVTIIKQPTPQTTTEGASTTTTTSTTPASSSAAMHAIKRHALDFGTSKELMDENEGPVTKSIRLTAALILRNLVNYSSSAQRVLRFYEPHLAGVALSNVESSRTIAQVLYEMNETHPI